MALEIYQLRTDRGGHSQVVAERFGIAAKTVRDIWNRRTWVHATDSITGKSRKTQMCVKASDPRFNDYAPPLETLEMLPAVIQLSQINTDSLPGLSEILSKSKPYEPLPWPCVDVSTSYMMAPVTVFQATSPVPLT